MQPIEEVLDLLETYLRRLKQFPSIGGGRRGEEVVLNRPQKTLEDRHRGLKVVEDLLDLFFGRHKRAHSLFFVCDQKSERKGFIDLCHF